MESSKPSASSLSWSRLGLGTGTLASLGRAASLDTVDEILATMTELGARVIDTADSYGSGDCEILLGRALRGRRDSFVLVTKAGYRLANLPGTLRPLNQFLKKGIQRFGQRQRFTPGYLESCLNDSLSRLKVSDVDAFLLHDPPLEVVSDAEVIRKCGELRDQGKACYVGISSGDPEVIQAGIASGAFQVIQTPANIGVAARLRSLWNECTKHGIHVIGNHVFSPACLAIAGMNHEKVMRSSTGLLPDVATVLCGTRKPCHLQECSEWIQNPLPASKALKLLDELAAVIQT